MGWEGILGKMQTRFEGMNSNPQAWGWSEVRKGDKGPKFQEPLSLGTLCKCPRPPILRMEHVNICTTLNTKPSFRSFTLHGSFLGLPKFWL